MAHFKPFARAKSGAPSYRDDSRRSYDDDSRSERRYRRRSHRNTGLIVLDLGL